MKKALFALFVSSVLLAKSDSASQTLTLTVSEIAKIRISGSGDYSKHGNVTVTISGSMTLDGLANLVVDAVNAKEGV